jgi:predicted amidohydrolase
MTHSLFAVAQMNSQDSIEKNLASSEKLMQDAQAKGASLLILPENFACFAAGQQLNTAARFDDIQATLQQLAAHYKLWIIAGSLPSPYRPDGQRVPNGRVRSASLLISPEAKTIARYDKIHLFDAQVADNTGSYQESATFEAGNQVVTAQTPFGTLGLMICYDLRFPELALRLRQQGTDILTAPAAFTYATGQLHWQLLLRARAIDSQCYVLGAAQQGTHGARQTWGHSAIVNQIGQVIGESTGDGLSLITANYDAASLHTTRHNMPLIQHRRLHDML